MLIYTVTGNQLVLFICPYAAIASRDVSPLPSVLHALFPVSGKALGKWPTFLCYQPGLLLMIIAVIGFVD